jgi:hypothetical protein
MNGMRIFAVAVVLVLIAANAPDAAAPAAVKPTAGQVRELMTVVRADQQIRKIMPTVFAQIWGMLDRMAPDVPSDLRTAITEEMETLTSAHVSMFVDAVVPIYVKHLTADEVAAARTFFSSPAGQSFSRKSPAIMIESMQAGQKIGAAIAQEAAELAIKRLRQKGYDL